MSKTKEKVLINWHYTCQLTDFSCQKILKNNISEAQKVQVDWLNNSESYKNDMQEKVNVLVRLQEAIQEKLKTTSYSEPIQFFTLVPDKCPRMHCSEYFNIFEYPHMKSKK